MHLSHRNARADPTLLPLANSGLSDNLGAMKIVLTLLILWLVVPCHAQQPLLPIEAVNALRPLEISDSTISKEFALNISGITQRRGKTYYTDEAKPQVLIADGASPQVISQRMRVRSGWLGSVDLDYALDADLFFTLDLTADGFEVTKLKIGPGPDGLLEVRSSTKSNVLKNTDLPKTMKNASPAGIAVSADGNRLWLLLSAKSDTSPEATQLLEFELPSERNRASAPRLLTSFELSLPQSNSPSLTPGGMTATPRGLWVVGSAGSTSVLLWLGFGAEQPRIALQNFTSGFFPTDIIDVSPGLNVVCYDSRNRRSYLLSLPLLIPQ
ncbi:hypothetical protein CVU37_13610 [candidate division BRC1 bacterium HGW-BRC1-1]|jgi:hypothetical protein|nr:MAG: hypothetical protein CVU37_13610 [candidate division BRC1 bacterium HGW-BRC1-1]